jgi:hypothetical protein
MIETRGIRRALIGTVAAALLVPGLASAQEGKIAAEVRREGERLAEHCSGLAMKELVSCGSTIVTDHPFHLAVGSLAPQNGFGFGGAFVAPQWKPNDDWRINWSADAVAALSGAWRAGAYAKFINSRVGEIGVTGPGGGTATAAALPRPYPTLTIYAQITSLPTVAYYGLGNDTAASDRTLFAERQSTIGSRIVWPIGRSGFFNRLNPSLIGELNGRWVQIGGSTSDADPSIETRFTDATAPNLANQPATLQLGEGVRIAPTLRRLQLTYEGLLQQYIAPADSTASFRRWTADLRHDFALYRTRRQGDALEQNGPNECATSIDRTSGTYGCPDPTLVTTDRVGTVGFRALFSRSSVSNGSRVPFYFQRTIGGSDIDGERLLASYDDYRFRAPNLLVFQETIEHSIWGPIGAFAAAEQGRVALIDDSLSTGRLRKTFGAGFTLRAGGVPMVTVLWAQGDTEGRHIVVTMNTSLLGGSSRPSLR